jgi:signal transduction histidine kinase
VSVAGGVAAATRIPTRSQRGERALSKTAKRAERKKTDHSLLVERAKTDRTIAETQAGIEADADEVVDIARHRADAVVTIAREQADAQSPASTRDAMVEERAVQDETLRSERAIEDQRVQREREESARVLARLFPLERDRTDRHLLTERAFADDALETRDNFLGMVSHDLRNLLGGIVMSAGLLSDSAADTKETVVLATRIERYAARMNRLIGDLVDVSSMEAGQLAIVRAPADVAKLIVEAADTFAASASAKNISLSAAASEPELVLELDRERIFQVLANLVTNAIKFTTAGGSVRIAAERKGGEILVSVADDGSGIPAEKIDAIFERFWQVGANDRRGVGLGLYIARSLVEAHGGRIWAESELGVGTTLWFTLPVVENVSHDE